MEYLPREMASLRLSVNELATRDYVRGELQSLLKELDERDRVDPLTHPGSELRPG